MSKWLIALAIVLLLAYEHELSYQDEVLMMECEK